MSTFWILVAILTLIALTAVICPAYTIWEGRLYGPPYWEFVDDLFKGLRMILG